MSQIFNVYSIYDVKGKFYGSPFTVLNDDLCLRLLDQLLHNPDTDYRLYPEDFVVYCIGEFDNNTAIVTSCAPRYVSSVKSRLDYLVAMANQSRSDLTVEEHAAEDIKND